MQHYLVSLFTFVFVKINYTKISESVMLLVIRVFGLLV